MKGRLQDNDIEMYSTHNAEKSVVAEKFTRILKNKIYKYITSISKKVCIKMRPTGLSSSKHFDFEVESNVKDPKFKVGDHVRK